MNSPTISVVMPVYNAANYLGAAIESILAQSFRDFDFIIVDDGSTDGSAAILDRFASTDSRITVIRRPNSGVTAALNTGLKHASGTFIARMDADDIAHPERFHKQHDYLNEQPNCVAVGSSYVCIDDEGDPLCVRVQPTCHDEIDLINFSGEGGGIAHPTALIRRDAIETLGGYRSAYPAAEDRDLLLRLAEIGKLANLDEPLLYYRVHAENVSRVRHAEQLASSNLAVEHACRRRNIGEAKRPTHSPLNAVGTPQEVSRANQLRGYAYLALKSGFYASSRKYGRRVWACAPWEWESLKVFARAYLGSAAFALKCSIGLRWSPWFRGISARLAK